jgi:hypothetical protein
MLDWNRDADRRMDATRGIFVNPSRLLRRRGGQVVCHRRGVRPRHARAIAPLRLSGERSAPLLPAPEHPDVVVRTAAAGEILCGSQRRAIDELILDVIAKRPRFRIRDTLLDN